MGRENGRRPATARPGDSWRALFLLAAVLLIAGLVLLAVVLLGAAGGDEKAPFLAVTVAGQPSNERAAVPEGTATAGETSIDAMPFAIDTDLQAAIESVLGEEIDHFGVVVRRLRDGRGLAINPDRVFYAASLYKLAVLYEAERRHAAGELDYDEKIEITEEDAAQDLGTIDLLELGPDRTLTIGAALEAMVTFSDNATAVALLHLFGGAAIDATLAEIGLQSTSVNIEELPTTAGDMAALMAAAYSGAFLDESSRDHLKALLLRQTWRAGIPAGLPRDVESGNKTGTWPGNTHDVAFVEAPNGPYVIAILCDEDYTWDAIARVSRAVYEELERR